MARPIPEPLKRRGIKQVRSNLDGAGQLDVGKALWLFFGDEVRARLAAREADRCRNNNI